MVAFIARVRHAMVPHYPGEGCHSALLARVRGAMVPHYPGEGCHGATLPG